MMTEPSQPWYKIDRKSRRNSELVEEILLGDLWSKLTEKSFLDYHSGEG